MKPQFTSNGVAIQTFEEIFEELATGYRGIYGQDINLSQESPDGQRVGIEARAILDVQQFCMALSNSFDPDFAFGQGLGKIAKLSGIFLRPGTRSQWDLTIATDRPVTLPVDYTLEDELGQKWLLPEAVALPTGGGTVTLYAEEFGAITGGIGAELEEVTFVRGVTGITAAFDAVPGRAEETDPQFRQRRNRSLENPAYSTVGGLYARLANLPGVTDLQVYENDQPTADPITGLPANSVWAVVENGTIDDIAETLTKHRTSGCQTVGDLTGTFVETLIHPNGSEFFITHLMRFDRPRYVDLHVRLTATRKQTNDPIDTELIKQNIAERTLIIGESIQAGELYENAYGAGSGYIVTDLMISDDAGATWTDGKLDPELDQKYELNVANVVVNEVIP
ncbi:MAG: baseplate J/gp47 family protein [Anaerolineaceae bacterium]|nr:baseplate J/gp47 family protein [Anaerolineaceae bacterium]